MSELTTTKSTKDVVKPMKKARAANGAGRSTAKSQAAEAEAVTAKAAKPKRGKAAPAVEGNGAPVEKAKRQKKEKVVRDSFTMPKSDYDKIAALKQRCLAAGVAVKKSELIRAGLNLLETAADKRLLAAVSAVETVKTGRPSKSQRDEQQ